MTDVQGRCPACRGASLFLGEGGHVTCARLDCPNPCAADQLLHGETAVLAATQAASIPSGLRRRIFDVLNEEGEFCGCPSATTDVIMRLIADTRASLDEPAPDTAGTEVTGAADTIIDPAYLREQYAAALRTRLAKVHAPGSHLEPEAVVDYIGCTEYDLADAVLAVRDRHLQQLRQRLALADATLAEHDNAINWHTTCTNCGRVLDSSIRETERAEKAEQQRDQLAATLREVLGEFRVKTHPGESCLTTYNIPVSRVQQWRTALDQTQEQP